MVGVFLSFTKLFFCLPKTTGPDDDWGAMDNTAEVSADAWGGDLHAPQPVRPHSTATPHVSHISSAKAGSTKSPPTMARAVSPAVSVSPRASHVSVPAKSPSPQPTTPLPHGLTKEEKAAEMARRKEERKQV